MRMSVKPVVGKEIIVFFGGMLIMNIKINNRGPPEYLRNVVIVQL